MMIEEKQNKVFEITLRRTKYNEETKKTKASLLRFFVFSLGLVQENRKKEIITDIIDSILILHFSGKTIFEIKDIKKILEEKKTANISERLLSYYFQKLAHIGFLVKKGKKFYFNEKFFDFLEFEIDSVLKDVKDCLATLLERYYKP